MDRKLALGTFTFALLSVVLGLGVQILIEQLGATSAVAGQVATYGIAIPLSLIAGRRAGRLTRGSVLLASVVICVAVLWAIVAILNAIAVPGGGHVTWRGLFSPWNWRGTVFGSLAVLLAPQVWLWLLNRMAANNSSKPTPLRGAA
jgi:hypothetical protein